MHFADPIRSLGAPNCPRQEPSVNGRSSGRRIASHAHMTPVRATCTSPCDRSGERVVQDSPERSHGPLLSVEEVFEEADAVEWRRVGIAPDERAAATS